jgi:outer membrane protein assembly factor BamB
MTTSVQSIIRWYAWILCAVATLLFPGALPAEPSAEAILQATGVQGGLIVHLGCGDGRLTAALGAGESYLVQGLDADAEKVARARGHIRSLGLYGKVCVDRFSGARLPYVDNLVNLVVAEDLGAVPLEEVNRVLCPNGVAYVEKDGVWTKTVKPRPGEIDEWTHYLHDASNNAVAHDETVGPPRRLQWVGSPKYARHHDRISSTSAVVSAGGRVFAIFDQAAPVSILSPPKWTLIARDAFNGTILWKREISKWFTHLWPLKSGPAELPRRLVAAGDRVYVTLTLDGPLEALDAATGQTVRSYDQTKATEEVIYSDGLLFALVNDAAEKPDYDGSARFRKGYNDKFWDEAARQITALRADSGEVLWTARRSVLPGTLSADSRRVVFHDGQQVVALDRNSGKELWRSEAVPRSEEIRSFYVPILVLYQDVVLFSGGETAGLQTGAWYTSGKDTLTALSAETGKVLWNAYHPPSGYRSPEDLLVAGGLVWTGETTSGRAVGVFTGRDPQTGEVKSRFEPDVDIYWFHHRCYRGKATDKYLLMARAGTEFIDVRNEHWDVNHWVRGACSYGVMPANGLLYAPQHPCACYLESKLDGFNALAPASTAARIPDEAARTARLEKGPVYEELLEQQTAIANPHHHHSLAIDDPDQWPTYRHDAARSGRAGTSLASALGIAWKADLGGRLTSPVIAGGKLVLASIDTHTVYALEADSGKPAWQFTAGGRVDSPPTIHQGRVLFGSRDGWVYCLRASDGALAWRFRAAPIDERLTSFEQVESVWPVHGSVLVQNGQVYCVAGRSMFLDGGLRLVRLDPLSGNLLSETVLDEGRPESPDEIQSYVSWLNMPPALPDVLSSDGRLVYMRSQPFDLDGTRLPLEAMPAAADADKGAPPPVQQPHHAHLFSPTGFLDDNWWHRSYWMYGSQFVSGWCGYFTAGKTAPAGKILVFDDETVYGFGRKPQYYRWTTPIEHHLFAAQMAASPSSPSDAGPQGSRVRIEKSASLNPAGKPVTVEAWVNAAASGGVILARGGGSQGYVLYVEGGRPHFSVRAPEGLATVSAKTKIVGRWAHVAGVLTAQKQLQIYVDGRADGTAQAAGLLTGDPAEAIEIGADEGSTVGPYSGEFGFTGLIDEVKLYRRALAPDEIAKHADAAGPTDGDSAELALALSFDTRRATDSSGNKNHGTIEGALPVEGKIGAALKFAGKPGTPPGFNVVHRWTSDLPLFARAMLLADKTLYIAGPPDMVDEEQAFRRLPDPEVNSQLALQAAAYEGSQGALLWAVSTADGSKLTEYQLDAPPVFDGLAAAAGRLYLATTSGTVVCFEGK